VGVLPNVLTDTQVAEPYPAFRPWPRPKLDFTSSLTS